MLGGEGRIAPKTYARFHVGTAKVMAPVRVTRLASSEQPVYKVSRAGRQKALVGGGSVRKKVPGSIMNAPPPGAHTAMSCLVQQGCDTHLRGYII